MEAKTHISQHRILELLDYVKDPEVPAINVLELGVVRSVEVPSYLADDRWTGFPADRINE